MNTENITLATNLALQLKQKKITKSELARDMQVTRQTVQAWLKKGSVSRENLLKLSKYFGIPISALVGEESTFQQKEEADVLKLELKERIDNVPNDHLLLLQYLKKMLS
ncbi:helix-turn-helix transcriptional regulator [Vibrio mediterranei]|uniref:helix-turn-helix domain-containing protein n=1 Tax=Vibrio mediterranei TaxID=689 RepID=UPI0038CDCA87